MTEERRREWVLHIWNSCQTSKLLGDALQNFEREVAEHAKRVEREACIQAVLRHLDIVGGLETRDSLIRDIAERVRSWGESRDFQARSVMEGT